MDEVTRDQPVGNGNGHVQRRSAVRHDHALARRPARPIDEGDVEQRESRGLESTPRKRKPKHRRRREPMPQPPKPMWPVLLMFAGAVLYFCMPWDLIPDLLVGPGQLDDLALFYATYRQWKSRKDGNSTRQEFRPRSDERTWRDDYGRSHEPAPPALFYDMAPQEKPGFFARLWKAFMYIISGGAL